MEQVFFNVPNNLVTLTVSLSPQGGYLDDNLIQTLTPASGWVGKDRASSILINSSCMCRLGLFVLPVAPSARNETKRLPVQSSDDANHLLVI